MRFSVIDSSRRRFLRLLSSGFLISLSSACGLGGSKWKEAAERMMEILDHPDRARMVGSLYVDGTPSLGDLTAEQWTGRLLATLEIDPDGITPDVLDSLAARMRSKVREDFVDENVVIVKGFMFSRTEIMLCALAATYSA